MATTEKTVPQSDVDLSGKTATICLSYSGHSVAFCIQFLDNLGTVLLLVG